MGLQAVERSPAAGAPGARHRPAVEPGARGWSFSDAPVAIRTQASLASIRLRPWNRGAGPVRAVGSQACPGGEGGDRPDAAGEWEPRGSGAPGNADVLDPGRSRERRGTPAARVRTPRAGRGSPSGSRAWSTIPRSRAPPRGWASETPGARFVYTFWYRPMEPPREEPARPARGVGAPAAAAPEDRARGRARARC